METAEWVAVLRQAAVDVGLEPSTLDLTAAARHARQLLESNRAVNLTRITSPAEIARRHFAESFLAATLVPDSARTLLDVGSGGGFPGLAMKAARPDLEVTLLEPVQRKAAFLRLVAPGYGGPATVVRRDRVEELRADSAWDVVTSRGVDLDPLATGRHVGAAGLVVLFPGRGSEGSAALGERWEAAGWLARASRALPDGEREVVALARGAEEPAQG